MSTETGKWEMWPKTNLKIALSVRVNWHRHSIREAHPLLWAPLWYSHLSYPPYEVQEIFVSGKECLKTLSHQEGTFVRTCKISHFSIFTSETVTKNKEKKTMGIYDFSEIQRVHSLWRLLGGLKKGLQQPSLCCCCKCMHTTHQHQWSIYMHLHRWHLQHNLYTMKKSTEQEQGENL